MRVSMRVYASAKGKPSPFSAPQTAAPGGRTPNKIASAPPVTAVPAPAPSATKSASKTSNNGPPAPKKAREEVPEVTTVLDELLNPTAPGAKAAPLAVLKGGRHKIVKDGATMIYDGAVDCVIGRPPPGPGTPVIVADGSRRPLAWGVFNPHSTYRVRVMQTAPECLADPSCALDLPAVIRRRVRDAVALRRSLGLPGPEADVYRLCNSEGDRISGLIADVVGEAIVVSASAYYVQQHQELITRILMEETGLKEVVWRPAADMLKEEGWPLDDAAPESEPSDQGEQRASGEVSSSSAPERVTVVQENGIKYKANLMGQKTGFYSDQRPNRAFVRSIAAGKARVLDLCCYSGGFALNAFQGGAQDVTGVDSSAEAVALATANAELNGFDAARCRFVKADVEDFMRQAIAKGDKYDLLILDPPKLAPSRKTLDRATIKYKRLNSLALQLVSPGGILITCTCSGAMAQSKGETGGLGAVVKQAAEAQGRRLTLLRTGEAAPCHPLDPMHEEGRYLEVLAYRVV